MTRAARERRDKVGVRTNAAVSDHGISGGDGTLGEGLQTLAAAGNRQHYIRPANEAPLAGLERICCNIMRILYLCVKHWKV